MIDEANPYDFAVIVIGTKGRAFFPARSLKEARKIARNMDQKRVVIACGINKKGDIK